jgi:hypothetical protein
MESINQNHIPSEYFSYAGFGLFSGRCLLDFYPAGLAGLTGGFDITFYSALEFSYFPSAFFFGSLYLNLAGLAGLASLVCGLVSLLPEGGSVGLGPGICVPFPLL